MTTKKMIKVFISADRSHIVVAEWKGYRGEILRYSKKETTDDMFKDDFDRKLLALERDNFYIQLERE